MDDEEKLESLLTKAMESLKAKGKIPEDGSDNYKAALKEMVKRSHEIPYDVFQKFMVTRLGHLDPPFFQELMRTYGTLPSTEESFQDAEPSDIPEFKIKEVKGSSEITILLGDKEYTPDKRKNIHESLMDIAEYAARHGVQEADFEHALGPHFNHLPSTTKKAVYQHHANKLAEHRRP